MFIHLAKQTSTAWTSARARAKVQGSPHLKSQTSLDLILQHVCDRAIEVGENLHRQLWVDAGIRNEIIESVRQGRPETVQRYISQSVVRYSRVQVGEMYLLRRYSS